MVVLTTLTLPIIFSLPPTLRLPPIPTPPCTTNAPVEVLVEFTLLDIETLSTLKLLEIKFLKEPE